MATVRQVGNSYQIRVSCGYDKCGKHIEESMYWTPEKEMSEKELDNELTRQKVLFQESVKEGYKTCSMKFEEFAEEWLTDYAENNHRNTTKQGEQTEKNVYTRDEMIELLARMENEPLKYRAFFTLAAYSGFRRSELLGLEWKDVDFGNRTISVVRTSNYTPGAGTFTDTTKTKKSRRTIKFSEKLIDLLKSYKDEQTREAIELGDLWVDTDRLFVKWNGEPMSNNTPYTWLKRFCDRENLRFCDIHSFRHFAASAMITSGIDLLTASRTLGHSQPSTTTHIDGHLIDDYKARDSEAISSVLE
jgi:integrase